MPPLGYCETIYHLYTTSTGGNVCQHAEQSVSTSKLSRKLVDSIILRISHEPNAVIFQALNLNNLSLNASKPDFCRKNKGVDQLCNSSRKHVYNVYPLNPTFIQQNWDMQGIPIFLIFAPKHRLWVLVRTALPRRF